MIMHHSRPKPLPRPAPLPGTQPFSSTEDAWFWTFNALMARAQGSLHTQHSLRVPRPCEPDDIIIILDRLFRQGRITAAHARVLKRWGERGSPPRAGGASPEECRLWLEALGTLGSALEARHLVRREQSLMSRNNS